MHLKHRPKSKKEIFNLKFIVVAYLFEQQPEKLLKTTSPDQKFASRIVASIRNRVDSVKFQPAGRLIVPLCLDFRSHHNPEK
jgi:hypothetical protein